MPKPPKPQPQPEKLEYGFEQMDPAMVVVSTAIKAMVRVAKPEEISWLIDSVLANAFGDMPDDVFQRVVHAASIPCTKEPCDCHIRRAEMFEGIEKARDNWQRFREEARQNFP